jgi:CheY-like chemotaxis protein
MAKILIADDHGSGRTILRSILTQQGGWTVCGEAVNGLDAVRLASELKPDLIVLDFSMPILDGVQAAREILKYTPAVPIVLFTLHYSPQLEVEAARAGVRKVIPKGNGASALIAALEESLGRVNPPVGPLGVVPDLSAKTDGSGQKAEPVGVPAGEAMFSPGGPPDAPAVEVVGPLAVPTDQSLQPLTAAAGQSVAPLAASAENSADASAGTPPAAETTSGTPSETGG